MCVVCVVPDLSVAVMHGFPVQEGYSELRSQLSVGPAALFVDEVRSFVCTTLIPWASLWFLRQPINANNCQPRATLQHASCTSNDPLFMVSHPVPVTAGDTIYNHKHYFVSMTSCPFSSCRVLQLVSQICHVCVFACMCVGVGAAWL